MKNLFYTIKWAYQRVVRGWDDTATWGVDSHFVEVVIPPLKEMCKKSLDELFICEENKKREEVLSKTIMLIENYELDCDYMAEGWSFKKEDNSLKALAMYFAENIGYYWD